MLGFAPPSLLVVAYVMASQALSGIAKDLTKMSSKSAVKLVVPEDDQSSLYRWVAVLTGSKNALKGVGFFLGGLLLTLFGFQTAALALAALVLIVLIATSSLMHGTSAARTRAKFKQMFSNNRAVNILAAARIFLFAARDVWFVVGLPFFLYSELGWSFWEVGTLLAVWVIGYGAVQAAAPRFVRRRGHGPDGEPDGRTAVWLALGLAVCPAAMALALGRGVDPTIAILGGLIPFGVAFAMNSAVHSYLILAYADERQGRDERRLLLHGQRFRAPRGHHPLRTALPVARAHRVPVGIGSVPRRGRPAVAPAPDRGHESTSDLLSSHMANGSAPWRPGP